MSRLTICTSCQMGEHGRHRYVVQAVSEGMMGGSVCTCKGECVDGRYEPKDVRRIAAMLAKVQRRNLEAT